MCRMCRTVVALCLIALPLLVQADVVTTIGTPPTEPPAGGDATLTVYFLNTGAVETQIQAPPAIAARISARHATIDTTLSRQGDEATRNVAAGAFWAVPYALTLPPDAAGTVAIELQSPGSPRTALVVADAAPGDIAVDAAPAADGQPTFRLGRQTLPNGASVPSNDSGIAEAILPRFSAHEPIYFVVGPDQPNAKFQVSFKYQLFNPDGSWSEAFPPLAGLHVAYSQTSFWNLELESAPFLDSSYRPELLWSAPDRCFKDSIVSRLGLQTGINHESNGRDGRDSRSLNVAYIRPSVTFGASDGFFLTFAPRIFTYVFDMDATNQDIADYRGHVDLKLIAGERDGLQLSVIGRVGDDWDKGSVQFDLSYPMRRFFDNNVDLYLHAQYFTGFGESLLEYDESTDQWRVGVSIVR